MLKGIFAAAMVAAFASTALADDVIYVVRPPSVASNAKVLPQNAFSATSTPSTPGGGSGNSAADVLVFQSPDWGMNYSGLKQNYTSFSHPADSQANISLSSGTGYLHPIPSSAGNCNIAGKYDLGLISTKPGIIQGGNFVATWNSNGKFEYLKFDFKKVGTYHLVVKCEGQDIIGATKAPWITYGQWRQVAVRVDD